MSLNVVIKCIFLNNQKLADNIAVNLFMKFNYYQILIIILYFKIPNIVYLIFKNETNF